jgi:hypothetical protein
LGASRFNRVLTPLAKLAALGSLQSSFCEPDRVQGAKAHVSLFNGRGGVAENPTLRNAVFRGRHLEV